MIELKEDYRNAKERNNALVDIYHSYFPKSFIIISPKTTHVHDGMFRVEFNLGNEYTGQNDPFRFNGFTISCDIDFEVGELLSETVVKTNYSDGFVFDTHVCTGKSLDEIPEVFTNTGLANESLTFDEVLEWFDGSCNKLYKLVRKALRRGELPEEWGEYIV